MLICGASFAGLAVARELAGSGADVLVIDRYEIGERQTSACGIPTAWLEALDLQDAVQQTFGELVIHTPHATVRYGLPWTFSTFDYRTLCGCCADRARSTFETAKVDGRDGRHRAHRPRRHPRRRWSSTRSAGAVCSAPGQHPAAGRAAVARPRGPPARLGEDLEMWIDRSYVPAGYGWSFPAGGEVRIGVGSFDPRFHVREPTVRLAADLRREAVRYQGNWIPHALRDATEDGVFFVGDSAGHCLPLTAEGIRTALYFGLASVASCARCSAGARSARRGARPLRALQRRPRVRVRWMLRVQRLVPRVAPRLLARSLRAMESQALHRLGVRPLPGDRPPTFRRGRRAGRRSRSGYRPELGSALGFWPALALAPDPGPGLALSLGLAGPPRTVRSDEGPVAPVSVARSTTR